MVIVGDRVGGVDWVDWVGLLGMNVDRVGVEVLRMHMGWDCRYGNNRS